MKNSAVLLVPSFLILSLLLTPPAPAATYVRVADENLADQATVIAEVRVLTVDPSPGADRPVTDYLVEVVDLIAGYVPGNQIVVRVPGGYLDGMESRVMGAPRFGEGQPALLFLLPSTGGTYRIKHLMLGAFAIDQLDNRRVAYRHLTDSIEVVPSGRPDPGPESPRDLNRFRAWLADRAQGLERPSDYQLEPPVGGMPDPRQKYTIINFEGRPVRWTIFDQGGGGQFLAHSSGQPGQPGGGFTQFRTALAVWTNHPHSNIRYTYGGTTTNTTGLTDFDGVNTVIYSDPNNTINDPYDCGPGGGGTLAVAAPWISTTQTHVHNGTTFRNVVGGDIVTNADIECDLPGNKLLEELYAHELGHTLGLGHSSNSGAQMWRFIHDDGRGARLHNDDKNAIIFLYGERPAAPSNLEAEERDDGIRLTWRDNSDDEATFRVERRRGSGSFSEVQSRSANTTAWLDTGGAPGTTYTYRVRAVNAAGGSTFTNEASATTAGVPSPGNLVAEPLSASEIQVTWEDNSDDETEFRFESRVGQGPFTLIATAPADTGSLVISSLASETSYTFRARAISPNGPSGYSNLASATTFGSPCECVEGPTTLCLDGGRFRVEVGWRDFLDATGPAQAVDFGSNNSGLLWFFDPENWEMLIKVLDGCGINNRYWVFAAATTDVEYTLEVTDCWAGATSVYFNPLGNASPAITDTSAFTTCSVSPPAGFVPGEPIQDRSVGGEPEPAVEQAEFDNKQGDCTGSDTDLCLDDSRFLVEVEWRDHDGNVGSGQVVATDSVNSGLMWFFDANNWEILVKVLNGCGINNRYWVFAAATTDVEYTLRVTDTETGAMSVYNNLLGNAADAITDISAFNTCP